MSEKCLKCFRPLSTCYCSSIKTLETDVKFIFLMHPKEAYHQHTGTGRLACLSLKDAEIIVGIDFTHNAKLNRLLSDPDFFPMVLYPGEDSLTAEAPLLKERCNAGKKLLIIVVDATWFFAKKMLRLSPNVGNLPKISFKNIYTSEFTFKRQPAPGCVSTIESCFFLIKELQQAGVISTTVDPQPLMDVFRKMVDFQLEAEQQRIDAGIPGRHSYDNQRDLMRKGKPRRRRVSLEESYTLPEQR